MQAPDRRGTPGRAPAVAAGGVPGAGARSGFDYSYPPPTGRCLVSRAGALVQSEGSLWRQTHGGRGQLRNPTRRTVAVTESRYMVRLWHRADLWLVLVPAGRVVLFHHAGGMRPRSLTARPYSFALAPIS